MKEYTATFSNGKDVFFIVAERYFAQTKEVAEEIGKITEDLEGQIQNFKYIEVIEFTDRQIYHHVGHLGSITLGLLSGEMFDAAEIRSKRGR